jgi:hypothetical protein
MKHLYMLWTGHLAVLILLAGGFWWLFGEMPGLPDYKLVIFLIAVTCLVLNHFRWWNLVKKIHEKDVLDKVDLLEVVNYIIFILGLALVDFHR